MLVTIGDSRATVARLLNSHGKNQSRTARDGIYFCVPNSSLLPPQPEQCSESATRRCLSEMSRNRRGNGAERVMDEGQSQLSVQCPRFSPDIASV